MLKLKESAAAGDNYRIRTRCHFSLVEGSSPEDDVYVYGYTRACLLVESGLRDHIHIHTDDTGAVVGVSMSTNASQCTDSSKQVPKTFSTTVEVNNGDPGSVPEVDGFLRKVAEVKEKEKNTDNRSFLQKYWMYIVIGLVMYSMLSAGTTLASQQGGGGEGGS
jgi:hypothetical protein